jgi:hypothetical protein
MAKEIVNVGEQCVAMILFGVVNCAGGVVIVNGKAHKIPPRGPDLKKITDALNTVMTTLKIKV